MKRNYFIVMLALVAIIFSGCADVQHVGTCVTGYQYGFWHGLWHGSITPISIIGEIFSDDIAIYAVNNTGSWYDFGFVIGIGGFLKLIAVLTDILSNAT